MKRLLGGLLLLCSSQGVFANTEEVQLPQCSDVGSKVVVYAGHRKCYVIDVDVYKEAKRSMEQKLIDVNHVVVFGLKNDRRKGFVVKMHEWVGAQ